MPEIPDQRMTDFEHLIWRLNADPVLSPAMANVSILDQPPDVAALRARMEAATLSIPRLRQRVVPSPGNLAPPIWRQDPDFDIANHVRVVRLDPDDNGVDALWRLAAQLSSAPMDDARPRWVFTVVEGLAGGGAAMVQQMDHSITDGEGGLRMSLAFIDFERKPKRSASSRSRRTAEPTAAPTDDADDAASNGVADLAGLAVGALPDQVTDALSAAGHIAARGWGLLRGAGESLSSTDNLKDTASEIGRLVASLGRQARSVERTNTALWAERSGLHAFAAASVEFEPVRAAAKARQLSINDVFVAACLVAAHRYHAARGEEVDQLNVSVPVSTRDGQSDAVHFAPTVTSLDVTDGEMGEQLGVVSAAMQQTKSEATITAIDSLATAANILPTGLVVRAGRWATRHVDLVCSNVRAAPFAVYIAGAKLLENYPIGPLMGAAVNITLMTNAGQMGMGIHTDVAAVADPTELAVIVTEVLDDFVEGTGRGRRTSDVGD